MCIKSGLFIFFTCFSYKKIHLPPPVITNYQNCTLYLIQPNNFYSPFLHIHCQSHIYPKHCYRLSIFSLELKMAYQYDDIPIQFCPFYFYTFGTLVLDCIPSDCSYQLLIISTNCLWGTYGKPVYFTSGYLIGLQ